MGAPKPTLGFPSRTAAVVALRGEGCSTEEIARQIGISTGTVIALEYSAARTVERGGSRSKRPTEAQGRTVLFPVDILESLQPHAQARLISPNELARRIVETVVDDNMVDAVLDDGGAT